METTENDLVFQYGVVNGEHGDATTGWRHSESLEAGSLTPRLILDGSNTYTHERAALVPGVVSWEMGTW